LKGAIKLANHASALKRARQNEIRNQRNRMVKTRVKNVVKSVRQALEVPSSEAATATLNQAKSTIAKAAKKGVIHKRNASRKIARLSKLSKQPKV
jgi:small subunit ribosomal protein S20